MATGELYRLIDKGDQFPLALVGDCTVFIEVAHQGQWTLVRRVRNRAGSRVCIDEQKVNGI